MLSLFAFHFALRRSLATAQSKPFGRPLLAAFVPIQHGSPPTSEQCTDALQDNKMFTPHLSRSEFRRRKKAFWPPTSKLESDWRFQERGFDPQSVLPLPTPHCWPLEQGNCRLL